MELPDCCYEYRNDEKTSKVIDICTECGYSIYEGDEYYDIEGKIICYDCIDYFKKTSEV